MTTIPTVQRRVDGARDPRTYGLQPDADGATNYAALSKALVKAVYDASVSGRGCVSIPAGQYDMDVTTPETFRPTTNVTIRGVPGATILRPVDPTKNLMQTSHLGDPPTGWLLEDFEIDMRSSEVTGGGTYPTAITINEGCTDFAIRRVKIRNANTGMILRGPGIERFDVDVEIENSGSFPIDGGAHAISVTGDSLDDAFDCRYGRIKLRGHNCLNGGVNLGQCQHVTVDIEVVNDYDPTTGPQGLSSYATLRLANASEHVRGRVIAIGTGRAFRGGPTRHHNLQIIAVNCLWEAALLSGKAFHGGGTRWQDTKLDIQAIDCCQLAGTSAVRVRAFDGADLHIIARNTPELIVLRSTLTLDDDGDPSPRATVRLVNKTPTQYPHQVSLVANGSNVDITILTDDDDENVVETYTAVANTNAAIAAAISTGNIFNAYTVGPTPTAVRLETKRRGTMGWRLFSEDPNAALAADITTSSASIKLSPDASIIAGAGDAPLTLPVEGELRSDITGKVERVLVTAPTATDTVSVLRHRGNTSAQAWTVANNAKLYAPLSRVLDTGGVSRRMSSGAVSISGPYAKVNTAALDTDSSVRRVSATTLNLPQDRDLFVLAGTTTIETLTGRWKGREVTLICEQVGLRLKHGTGNLKLHNGQDFVSLYANQILRLRVDTDSINWLEISPCSR